jgi:GTP cyclohydrolase FolE2
MKHPEDTAASLRDTQNESDHRRIVIDRVGVKNLRFPIQVAVGPGAPQSTIATVQLTVELPQEFKGTHMSRFLEVLQAHGTAPRGHRKALALAHRPVAQQEGPPRV